MQKVALKTSQYNVKFYFMVGLVLSLYAISKSYEIESLSYIASIISVIFCLFAPIEKSILLVFCVCPNTYFSMLGTSAICGWLAILCAIRLVIKNKGKTVLPVIMTAMLLLTYSIAIIFLNDNTSFFSAAIKILGLMLLLGMIPMTYREATMIIVEKLMDAYVLGAVLGACLGVLHYLLHGMNVLATELNSLRFVGLANDPNYLSATFCFAISLILVKLYFGSKSAKVDMLCLGILSIAGVITLSRAFIVCYALVIIFYLLVICLRGSLKVRYLLLVIIFAVVGYALFYEKIEAVLNMVVFRFTNNQYSGGGGRLEVWQWYLKQFASSLKSFFFGSTPGTVVYEAGLVNHIEHNTFIQLLYELGVVGAFIYVSTILSSTISYGSVLPSTKTKNYGIGYLPLIAVIGPYFFLSALTGENFILTLALALIVKKCIDHKVIDNTTAPQQI